MASNSRVFLHTPEPASSAALYVHELSQALTQAGLPVHVICPANHQARATFEANPLLTLHLTHRRRIEVSHGLLAKIWSNLLFLFSSCRVLLGSTRSGDIVHFQYVLHFPFGALFFLCALVRRCTVVFTVHDPLPHKWLLPPRWRALEQATLAWSYAVSDVLLVHSEAGKLALEKHFPSVSGKIRVIAHGPYELPSPVPSPPPSGVLEVLLFGALRENKGAHLAIAAVQQLHKAGIPIRLTIAGRVLNRKEQSFWDGCKALIERCPEPIRLREEFIPDRALPELFGACHCFLLPYTSFSSDSGVAFMALANGRPIVATKSGGLGSLLAQSGGGLAIEQATPDSVAQALKDASAIGFEALSRIGHVGKAWVLEECGWPTVARQTIQVYSECSNSTADEKYEHPTQPVLS